jgi:hypothetical protein
MRRLVDTVRDDGNAEGSLFPIGFGMYIRLTASGMNDCAVRCACSARSMRAGEVNATFPSMPAVVRPALRCATWRTLTSVLDQLRSISFCRFLTFGRSPSFVALKILPRSRRTFSSWRRQATVSQFGVSPSGPFTPRAAIAVSKAKAVIASNLSFGSGGSAALSSKARPPHVSLLSQPDTRPGIRPVIRQRPVGGPVVDAAAFLSPFSHRHSLLGRPVPATGLSFPHGRPTATKLPELLISTSIKATNCCHSGGRAYVGG